MQDEEIAMLEEVTHLQEILQQLCMQAGDPSSLPAASEQVILDIKGGEGQSWSFQVRDDSCWFVALVMQKKTPALIFFGSRMILSLQQTPPSSPSSLGSRKSSMCSISSIASSSSGSTQSHSPSHQLRQRNSSQVQREGGEEPRETVCNAYTPRWRSLHEGGSRWLPQEA